MKEYPYDLADELIDKHTDENDWDDAFCGHINIDRGALHYLMGEFYKKIMERLND